MSIEFLSMRDNDIPDERITVLEGPRMRIIEYQHNTHLAVFEYDGINGSKNITHTLSGEERRKLQNDLCCILLADEDEFEPYE